MPESKLLAQCSMLFASMSAQAESMETDGGEVVVWRGRLLPLADELGLARGTYSRVINALRKMGCVEQVNRGFRGTSLAEYVLVKPPTEADFCKISPDRLTDSPSADRLAAELSDVQKQIGGIDIVEAFKNIEERLRNLERAVQDLTATTQTTQ